MPIPLRTDFDADGVRVGLVTELRPAEPSVLAPLFLVRRGRLGRRARILIGTLKPKHQLDQLLLAELLQITPVHPRTDSEFAARGRGVVKCRIFGYTAKTHTVRAVEKSKRTGRQLLVSQPPTYFTSLERQTCNSITYLIKP